MQDETLMYKCKRCGTVVRGQVGICPKCGKIQTPENFEEMVSKAAVEKAEADELQYRLTSAKMARISLIVALAITLLISWFPYIGIGVATLSLIFTAIIAAKGRKAAGSLHLALGGVVISVVGIALGIILSILLGPDFWAMLLA